MLRAERKLLIHCNHNLFIHTSRIFIFHRSFMSIVFTITFLKFDEKVVFKRYLHEVFICANTNIHFYEISLLIFNRFIDKQNKYPFLKKQSIIFYNIVIQPIVYSLEHFMSSHWIIHTYIVDEYSYCHAEESWLCVRYVKLAEKIPLTGPIIWELAWWIKGHTVIDQCLPLEVQLIVWLHSAWRVLT